jgi:hypothetical protein
MMYDELFSLWALSTVKVGGLDWSPGTIGQVLSISGVFMAGFQFVVYPAVAQRLGYMRMLKLVVVAVIPLYIAFPACSLAVHHPTLLWFVVVFMVVSLKICCNMIFTR